MVTVHYRRWCPPASPLRIEFRAELLDDVRRGSVRPSLFHPEINQTSGLLFGLRQLDEVRILSSRGDAGLSPLGIFVCRARGEVFLTDDDLANFERHQGLLALVVAGGRAGFFVREPDGSIQAIRSHEEFPVASLAAPPVAKNVAKKTKSRPGVERPIPAPGLWPAWKRMTACAAVLAVPAGAFAYLRPLLRLPIALALREEAGQLVIGWNVGALMDGSRLEIRDGSERTLLMLAAHTSSATYGPQGSDVEVRLTTDTRTGGAHWEAARFISRVSPRQPAAFGPIQDRITALKREAQMLRRSLIQRQARTGELVARMDELISTPER
jgi:hypothetical protein